MERQKALQEELSKYLRARTEKFQFSGVVRMTQGTEEVYSQPFGAASRAWQMPVTMDTRFDTASLTKLFTAVSTLQRIDAGDFTLDTPVIPYLGLSDTEIHEDVTVLQLLTHSSGIGDDAEEENGEDYADIWREKANYSVRETADFLPQFANKPANFAPGEHCRYCNCSFVLLGLMIEKATGVAYRDYVRENIFGKAGMDDSDFFDQELCTDKLAEGSDPIRNEEGGIVGWKNNIYSFPPIGSPDSGAHVTAADLDRFLRAVKSGDLLSSENTKLFFTPQIPYQQHDGWEMQYGTGMWFYVEPDGRVVCCQEEGYNAGVSAIMRYYFEEDINVVILSNMADGAWAPMRKIHSLLCP